MVDPKPEDLPRILHEAMLGDPSASLEKDMLNRLAFAYMDEPRVWAQCKAVLKQHKYVREVEPRIKALAREFAEIPSIGGEPTAERSVSEIWSGAPITDDVYAPGGYAIVDGTPAIERLEMHRVGDAPYEKRIPVSLTPAVITRRIGHVQSKTILLEVQFRTNHGWRRIIQDRDVFFNARKIIDTAKMGVPVGSDNAMELSRWLRHYEDANVDRIPLGYASSSMGWLSMSSTPQP